MPLCKSKEKEYIACIDQNYLNVFKSSFTNMQYINNIKQWWTTTPYNCQLLYGQQFEKAQKIVKIIIITRITNYNIIDGIPIHLGYFDKSEITSECKVLS